LNIVHLIKKSRLQIKKRFLSKEIFERGTNDQRSIDPSQQSSCNSCLFRSKEDTNDRLDILVAVDGDVISKRLMIETILTCLDQHRLSLLVTAHWYGVVDQRFEVIEESQQFINGNRFDRNTRENKFLVCVTR